MTDAPATVRLKRSEFHAAHAPEQRDIPLELIDGEVVRKMPTHEHGFIVAQLIMLFGLYFRQRGQRANLGPEIRFEMPGDDENSRLPDLAIFTDPQRPIQSQGAVEEMADIAIEVGSPDDSRNALIAKAEYYLAHGAKQAWIVYPKLRKIEIMTPDDVEIYGVGDIIDGGDALPDFTLDVAEIFNYPRTE